MRINCRAAAVRGRVVTAVWPPKEAHRAADSVGGPPDIHPRPGLLAVNDGSFSAHRLRIRRRNIAGLVVTWATASQHM